VTTETAGRPRHIISIRWIISGAAVALTAMSVLGVGAFAERSARRTLTRELQNRLLLEARNLALTSSGALLSEFPELTLTPILSKMKEDNAELEFAIVTDLENTIRGHADPRRIGQKLQLSPSLFPMQTQARLGAGEGVLADGLVLVASAPVVRRGGERIGTSYVAVKRAYVESTIRETRRKQLLLVGILLAAGTVVALVLVSFLLRPVSALREGLERIGRGDLDTPVELHDRTELGLLAETMNEMSQRLKSAQEEHAEKERLAREVELAREIQASLLPASDLNRGRCLIDGAHRAAAEVGGDYWDVFPLADGRVGVAIADVSGKGLAGCLVTSMLAALLRAFRDTESSPSALLVRLERHLGESLRRGTFITMFYGILDPDTGRLVFASAGHSPLLVWRAASRTAEWFRTTGIPLGAVSGGVLARTLRDERVDLGPGDLAIQYTDGINEAFDIEGKEQFGFERLESTVSNAASRGCRAVIESIRRDVGAWAGDQPPLDDETLLVISHEGRPAAADEIKSDPLAALRHARASGHRLTLSGRIEALTGIGDWIDRCPDLRDLSPREAMVLESALYETAANIAEHGLENNPGRSFDLWWVPGKPGAPIREGLFVFVDDGTPFQPPDDSRVDFRLPSVRRRGRGLGLEIILKVMRRVAYHPGTGAGNVTVMSFDPQKIQTEEEVTHG